MKDFETNQNGFANGETEEDILNEVKEQEEREKDQERFNELSGLSDEEIEANGKNIELDSEGRVVESEE